MGYKNTSDTILKGSITPANVIEKQQQPCFDYESATKRMGETSEKVQKWLELKFSTCPISCCPFKLGHATVSDEAAKTAPPTMVIPTNNNAQPTTIIAQQPTKSTSTSEFVMANKYFTECDVFSLAKLSNSSDIELDVNNQLNKPIQPKDVNQMMNVVVDGDAESFKVKKKKHLKEKLKLRKHSTKKKLQSPSQPQPVPKPELSKSLDDESNPDDLNRSMTFTFSSLFGDSSLFAQENEEEEEGIGCSEKADGRVGDGSLTIEINRIQQAVSETDASSDGSYFYSSNSENVYEECEYDVDMDVDREEIDYNQEKDDDEDEESCYEVDSLENTANNILNVAYF
jgi:hypothetical protein